jgi:chromosome segregation ATPase
MPTVPDIPASWLDASGTVLLAFVVIVLVGFMGWVLVPALKASSATQKETNEARKSEGIAQRELYESLILPALRQSAELLTHAMEKQQEHYEREVKLLNFKLDKEREDRQEVEAKLQERIESLQTELLEKNALLEAANAKIAALDVQLQRMRVDSDKNSKLVENLKSQLDGAQKEKTEMSEQIKVLRQRIQELESASGKVTKNADDAPVEKKSHT